MNGILLIDKPQEWTSHDVVAKTRGILRERRIGHGGTLDPLATGLLVLMVGRATRAVPYLDGMKTDCVTTLCPDGTKMHCAMKTYRATARFGLETDTQDIIGNVTQTFASSPSKQEILAMLPQFIGHLTQIPPMVSAVKVNGERLYKIARRGETVERAPRSITVDTFQLLDEDDGAFTFDVIVSGGTYIRTLLHDLGHALGSGGVMTALRRTAAGCFSVDDACKIDEVTPDRLLPLDTLFQAYPALSVAGKDEQRLRNGNAIPAAHADGFVRVYGADGGFLLLGCVRNGTLFVEKSFYEP